MARVGAALLIVLLLLPALPPRARAQTTEADLYVAQAVLLFDDKHYEEALTNLRRALEIEPDHVEALYYMALVRLAQGQPAEAVPLLLKAREKAPQDSAVAFQLGLAYFSQQQYDQAQPLLEEVFKTQPTLDGLGYYVGFMRYRAKDYKGARAAFAAGRTSDERLKQLTLFYSGLSLAALGLPREAAAEVEQALALAPATALTGPAERLKEQIASAKRERGRLVSIDLKFGGLYDTNVDVRPNFDASEPLVGLIRNQKHESPGWLGSARFQYNWLDTESWSSWLSTQFFGTQYTEVSKFNTYDYDAAFGLAYRIPVRGMLLQSAASYDFDVLFLDQHEFVRRNTVTLSSSLVWNDRHLSQVFARFQDKYFDQRVFTLPDENRSGDNYMVGGLHLFRFAQDRHFIKLGYQWDWDVTIGRNWEYIGHRWQTGGQYTLPWYGIRLRYDFDIHFANYLNKNTLLPTFAPGTHWRYDQEMTHQARIEVPLPKGFTWSLEWLGAYTNSSLAVFAYKRDVFTSAVSWSY